ncbi:Response regulator receiver domain-containing protein [Ekhidna lutea]|uniref:Response regulator receiver domain-containing protein n=1 Tax=Ekhidna lutea TaxID=447679 RepID=A0A239K771_EKHLU|nr:response regulator [Ekhidna lutea]SNT13532.1 Response regulator receiver domain-containing protein [Ekhidna lutea]
MKRILIADDSFFQRKILGDIVDELGHKYEAVSSGEEMLEKLDDSFDCIFLDLLMGGMSGIEALKELKKRNNSVPVIVITADVQKARREESLELGAAGFMNKVVSKDELERILNDVLSQAK